jgi:hypothetical protein
MRNAIIQGDALAVLRSLPAEYVQCVVTSPPYYSLFQVVMFRIVCAVYPFVARTAKRDEVAHVESERRVACPRLDMVGVQGSTSRVRRVTALAPVTISCVDSALYLFPFGRCVQALAFWRTAVNIMRVGLSYSTTHAVALPSQVWLFNRSLSTQYSPRFYRMFPVFKWINSVWLSHVAITIREVVSSWSRRDAKIYQLLIDALWVTLNNGSDFISGKTFNLVLLTKPFRVKVWRFIQCFTPKYGGYCPILTQSMGVVNYAS